MCFDYLPAFFGHYLQLFPFCCNSEALTLRVPDTQEYFRGFAQAVAIVFFGRWLIQMKNHVRENFGADEDRIRFLRTYQIFSAKFILEVCGGAGAIWGFSEVLTLRNAETVREKYKCLT